MNKLIRWEIGEEPQRIEGAGANVRQLIRWEIGEEPQLQGGGG